MKIGILTFHRAVNYGAVLQAYALQNALERCGADAEIIDYRAPFNENRFKRKKLWDLRKPRDIYAVLFRNSYIMHDRNCFEEFYQKLKLSKVYWNVEELAADEQKYDKFVCGSDQVWNLSCTEGDDAYFLPFVECAEKKYSYAASIGYREIPVQFREIYQKFLKDFHRISVREKGAVELVKEFTDRDVSCEIDPTLLLTEREWHELADDGLVPPCRYLLLYLMSEDKAIVRFAKNLAKKEGCRMIYIHNRLFKTAGMENVRSVTPAQWLGLFEKASYVCTNSFHGLVFSINFHRQFFVKLIPRSVANSRIESVLEEYGLSKRLTEQWDGRELDYEAVDAKLRKRRMESFRYMERIVTENRDDGIWKKNQE